MKYSWRIFQFVNFPNFMRKHVQIIINDQHNHDNSINMRDHYEHNYKMHIILVLMRKLLNSAAWHDWCLINLVGVPGISGGGVLWFLWFMRRIQCPKFKTTASRWPWPQTKNWSKSKTRQRNKKVYPAVPGSDLICVGLPWDTFFVWYRNLTCSGNGFSLFTNE